MDFTKAKALVKSHEGLRLKVYRDSRGVLTIGWGCNLETQAAQIFIVDLGVDFKALCAGRIALTLDQAEEIFEYDFDCVVAAARINFPGFDRLPDNAGAVIIDMIFELGWAGFMEFREFAKAVKASDWTAAIAAMRDSLWAKQVPRRVENDVLLLQELG